ncbi:hypothetical protein OAS46_03645 [Alphaproteobacteria bacterium]|nr:hypothetical protein [Alphaproteobacteria bacterium]MDC1157534.1 hypothetical protein [Alphaproteobacteria bacterium]
MTDCFQNGEENRFNHRKPEGKGEFDGVIEQADTIFAVAIPDQLKVFMR